MSPSTTKRALLTLSTTVYNSPLAHALTAAVREQDQMLLKARTLSKHEEPASQEQLQPGRRTSSFREFLTPTPEFSDVSSAESIAALCRQHVPQWTNSEVHVRKLTEGLTNQLFQVSLVLPDSDVDVSTTSVDDINSQNSNPTPQALSNSPASLDGRVGGGARPEPAFVMSYAATTTGAADGTTTTSGLQGTTTTTAAATTHQEPPLRLPEVVGTNGATSDVAAAVSTKPNKSKEVILDQNTTSITSSSTYATSNGGVIIPSPRPTTEAVSILPLPGQTSAASPRQAVAPLITVVLFRIYGKDIHNFYDSDVEVRIFEALSRLRIAPRMYAKGDGWRIEEWHFAKPVSTQIMDNPSIYCQIASHLGRFHKLAYADEFAPFKNNQPTVMKWLDTWVERAWAADQERPESFFAKYPEMAENAKKQAVYLKTELEKHLSGDQKTTPLGFRVVFCHNDCQENNVLQTQYGLRLIDFEYSGFNFQGHDIANFFNEWLIDYIVDDPPYFKVDEARGPSETDMKLFASVYLSEFLEEPVKQADPRVAELLHSLHLFRQVSHLLWAFWSVLRAPQSQAFDEFDFLAHAKWRFDSAYDIYQKTTAK
ncbi:unnamed protein product [Amoebophrya sp. A120]|nr:unnamed protein product [Amoebophrya sp. A120]|eukprot:GSA120T00004812001.1